MACINNKLTINMINKQPTFPSYFFLLTSIPRSAIHPIVEPTGVAKVLSLRVPAPKGRGRSSAVAALTARVARVSDAHRCSQLTCHVTRM